MDKYRVAIEYHFHADDASHAVEQFLDTCVNGVMNVNDDVDRGALIDAFLDHVNVVELIQAFAKESVPHLLSAAAGAHAVLDSVHDTLEHGPDDPVAKVEQIKRIVS